MSLAEIVPLALKASLVTVAFAFGAAGDLALT
jgi:hypothetical protein